jgi:hypothetical protein
MVVGMAFMLAGRRTVVGAQDPAGPGRGQAPATGRGAAANQRQNLTRPDVPNPYRTVENIVTMPPGRTMGSTNAINVDAKGNIWVFERCGVNSCADSNLDPILQFDPSGKLLRSFGKGMFVFPHGLEFDADGNIWIVDAGSTMSKAIRSSSSHQRARCFGHSASREFAEPTVLPISSTSRRIS